MSPSLLEQTNIKAVAKKAKAPTTVKGMLNDPNFAAQIAKVLPKHLTAERMTRVALTAIIKNPRLGECTMETLAQSMLDCSSIGLEPDGRKAHLIPYRNNKKGVYECQLIVDYKGLIELARRSGEISDIHLDVVCENDLFDEEFGQVTRHKIDRRNERGNVFAAYSRVVLKDGTVSCEIMSLLEISAIKARSKAGNSGPWVTDFNEMAKKTVFRRHSKRLPMSSEFQKAMEKDFDTVVDVTPAQTVDLSTLAIPAGESKADRLAAELSGETSSPVDVEPEQDSTQPEQVQETTQELAPDNEAPTREQLVDLIERSRTTRKKRFRDGVAFFDVTEDDWQHLLSEDQLVSLQDILMNGTQPETE